MFFLLSWGHMRRERERERERERHQIHPLIKPLPIIRRVFEVLGERERERERERVRRGREVS